jgi:Zn-dependent peptidase ImmA (M78 family)/DNA-binding XRE family transcriptional regulator
MFNGKRLSLARMRRRLTGKALADSAGLTPVTITRLEHGDQEPEPNTVERLAEALRYPLAFFFKDNPIEVSAEAASFRSLTKMTARERDAALAAGSLALELSEWVGARFNLPPADVLDLSYERNAEAAARSLRQHWGLGEKPVPHAVKLLEAKGIRVFSLSENADTVDAFSCWRDTTPFVFLNTMKTAERSRFDALHELGHLVLHQHGGPKQARAAEFEAHQFAMAFLMPASDVKACLPVVTSVDTVIKAKARWRVSAMALAYRLNKLSILSDWQYRSVCIELGRRGYRSGEPNGIPRETSILWKKVLTQLWSERVTKQDIANELQWPSEELESLVFELVSTAPPREAVSRHRLKLVE